MLSRLSSVLAQTSPDVMQELPDRIFIVILVAIGAGTLITLVGIIWGVSAARTKARDREESRRELAAYVAEGTMTIEDAERLMHAGDWRGIAHAAVCRVKERGAAPAPSPRPMG